MPTERLQKVLAAAGIASRRGSEALIAAGRVTVDGTVAVIGQSVDPAIARIAVDGRPLRPDSPRHVHLAMHKPAGVVSTVRDRHAERTVVDLVPREIAAAAGRLYPVGRLDRDSEGLLLLTNDGDWAEQVLHPRHGVEREYAIAVAGPLDTEQRRALVEGIELDEGVAIVEHLRPATPVETRRLDGLLVPPPRPVGLTWYRGTLRQGWKRQLRRMFAAVDAPVLRLVRVRIGTVRLDDLRSGDVRVLTSAESRRLAALAAGGQPAPEPPPGDPVDAAANPTAGQAANGRPAPGRQPAGRPDTGRQAPGRATTGREPAVRPATAQPASGRQKRR